MTTELKTYRGWELGIDSLFGHTATHPDTDCSYEGPEDGWDCSHPVLYAANEVSLRQEIDAWWELNCQTCDEGSGFIHNNGEVGSPMRCPCPDCNAQGEFS